MSQILDNFLEFLAMDGDWHNLSELARVFRQTEKKILIITNFLSQYNFLRLDIDQRKVKINVKFRDLLLATTPGMPIPQPSMGIL